MRNSEIPPPQKILVIRQDNIGDLVCTTPLIEGLNVRFPAAQITVLCTTYNEAVLDRNPFVAAVGSYSKGQHSKSLGRLIGAALRKVVLILRLRRERFDLVVAATTPCNERVRRLVWWLRPVRWIRSGESLASLDEVPARLLEGKHEVERVWELGKRVGLEGLPPRPRIYPDEDRCAALRQRFSERSTGCLIAVHISSRKTSQQWPLGHFVKLLKQMNASDPTLGFVVLWAPGDQAQAAHAGDDDKASLLATALGEAFPVTFHPTPSLAETMEALAACDVFVGSDGGAMHLAAACGLPVVALFGGSNVERWYPWAARSEVLQKPSRQVRDITPEEVALAALTLFGAGSAVN